MPRSSTPIGLLTAALLLAACASGGEAAPAATDPPATITAPTTTAPATTTSTTSTTVSDLERNRAVNEFVDAAASNADCVAIECMFAQAVYDRYGELSTMAMAIPGDDVHVYADGIRTAYNDWTTCFASAVDRFDCGDQETAVADAIDDLYDALR